MAQPRLIVENIVHWKYRGQKKVRELRYFTATHPDYDDVAKVANEEFAAELREYSGACETGTAVIVEGPK